MKIINGDTFWIVTKPTKHSTLVDIIVKCTSFSKIEAQFLGGLSSREIYAQYTDEVEATFDAEKLLAERDKT